MLKLFSSSSAETQETSAALRPLHPDMVAGTLEVLKSGPNDAGGMIATTLAIDAIKAGASDVHLDPTQSGSVVRFRINGELYDTCLLYTSPSPRDQRGSRMPSSA